MDNIDKYIDGIGGFLGVHEDRFGSYHALIESKANVEFIFECIDGDDTDYEQIISFLGDAPTFPHATDSTPSNAIKRRG